MTTAGVGRKFARQPGAWLKLASWKYAAAAEQRYRPEKGALKLLSHERCGLVG